MNVLLVAARDPWPARRGDQLRANQLLQALGDVTRWTVLAPGEGGGAPPPGLPRQLRVVRYRRSALDRGAGLLRAALTGRPLQSGLFASRDLDRRLGALAAEADLAVVQLARLEGVAERLLAAGGLPVVVDLIDALSLGAASRAAVDRRAVRPLLRLEAERLARAELRLAQRCAAATVVAERDRRAIAERGAELARLHVVPLAWTARPAPQTAPPGDTERLVLTGNLGYFVNRDAARFTLDVLWPELRARRPRLELVIAGARPSPSLARLASARGARLLADPPDLGAVLAGAHVALAPMRCGSGTPVKILEAWGAGVPVVASPYAAAGTAGVTGRELLVADRPGEWVEAVSTLLERPERAAELVAGGRALLEREHSPERVAAALAGVLARLGVTGAKADRKARPTC
ncbi:MAG TPA: glycosyltransferase family 4 protein [Thermoanaerobaculia bacterium]|nr:glycosyltransferase family 4 protein [Thermoanaerobaculia bacterium]